MLNWLLPVGTMLLLLSSAAHAFLGWPPIRTALEQSSVAEDLIGGLAVGWYFGSASMMAFAFIVFIAWLQTRGHKVDARGAVAAISVTYIVFGSTAFVARSFNPHFLGFIVIGLIVAIPLLAVRQKPERKDPAPG
jgi:hypothetical protein